MTHKTPHASIAHLTEAGYGQQECWCMEPCCNRPQAPGGLPVCVCPDCSCMVPLDEIELKDGTP
jgi:hypothetical protein